MIKVSIEPPKERLVTITMSESEAKQVRYFLGALSNSDFAKICSQSHKGHLKIESAKPTIYAIHGRLYDIFNGGDDL